MRERERDASRKIYEKKRIFSVNLEINKYGNNRIIGRETNVYAHICLISERLIKQIGFNLMRVSMKIHEFFQNKIIIIPPMAFISAECKVCILLIFAPQSFNTKFRNYPKSIKQIEFSVFIVHQKCHAYFHIQFVY